MSTITSTTKLLATVSLGLIATACAGPYQRQALVSDSRPASSAEGACLNYGFSAGTLAYDNCVQREASGRRYQQGTVIVPAGTYTYTQYPSQSYTPYSAPAYGQYSTPVYTTGTRVETQPVVTASGQVWRDEYGYRYDGDGNYVDRNGRIVGPYTP